MTEKQIKGLLVAHFGNTAYIIQDHLDWVSKDENVLKDFPKLSKIFDVLGDVLFLIIQDLNDNISGNQLIKFNSLFEEESIKKLKECLE